MPQFRNLNINTIITLSILYNPLYLCKHIFNNILKRVQWGAWRSYAQGVRLALSLMPLTWHWLSNRRSTGWVIDVVRLLLTVALFNFMVRFSLVIWEALNANCNCSGRHYWHCRAVTSPRSVDGA